MNRTTLISIVALIIALISLGLSLMPRSMVPQLRSGGKQWREIASFSGSGNTTTASFFVPSYLWRINWNVTWKGTLERATFLAYIYSPGIVEKWQNALDGLGGYKDYPSEGQYKTGHQTFYGSGNEDFYFKIEVSYVKLWKIEVEAWS